MTDMKTWIHIGLPKTGTTALQRAFFSRNRQILYLGKFEVKGHPVNSALFLLARRPSREIDMDAVKELLFTAIEDGTRDPDKRVCVLSEEMFASTRQLDPAVGAGRLSSLFPKANVLLAIRDPIDWLQSMYFYLLSLRFAEVMNGFEEWVETNLNVPTVGSAIGALQVGSLSATYADQFGTSNLSIVRYEDFRRDAAGFIRELCRVFGIDGEVAIELYFAAGRKVLAKRRVTEAQAMFCRNFQLAQRHLFRDYIASVWPIVEQLDEARRQHAASLLPNDFDGDPELIVRQLRRFSEYLDRAAWRYFVKGRAASVDISRSLHSRILGAVEPGYRNLTTRFGVPTEDYFHAEVL